MILFKFKRQPKKKLVLQTVNIKKKLDHFKNWMPYKNKKKTL